MNRETIAAIERELAAAKKARHEGNDGRSRACARRAAGLALAPSNEPARSAVDLLRQTSKDTRYPETVRNAALRLTTNVRDRLSENFSLLPENDAMIVITYIKEQR